MKTLGKSILWAICAVLLTAPLRADDGAKKASASPAPADAKGGTPDGLNPHPGGFPGGVTGNGIGVGNGGMNQGMNVRREAWNSLGPWGTRGPDAATAAKLKKAEDLQKKSVDQAAKMRDADAAGQAAAKADLRKTLGELFDVKWEIESLGQQALEQRAAKLKARLDKRKASREELIDKRIEELSGDGDDDWD